MTGTTDTTIRDADMNEMRMCADCLGRGRHHVETALVTCVACNGAGRVLTYRARMIREQRRERLSAAAPALYEALKELDATFRKHGLATSVYYVDALDKATTALALVDAPTTEEGKEEQPNG